MLFVQKSGGVSWIAVFLGNPGREYAASRHNMGFLTCDAVEKLLDVRGGVTRLRFKALTARCVIGSQGVLLMKPQTYMNLSGDAVREAASFYKVPPERVIVVSDDIDLPTGKLRVRKKGSAGGHNGLKSIIARLGTDEFPRIKIGVGAPPHPEYDVADWVLSGFSPSERTLIDETIKKAAEAVVYYIENGPERTMERFN